MELGFNPDLGPFPVAPVSIQQALPNLRPRRLRHLLAVLHDASGGPGLGAGMAWPRLDQLRRAAGRPGPLLSAIEGSLWAERGGAPGCPRRRSPPSPRP